MRRRIMLLALTVVTVISGVLATPRPAQALRAWYYKGVSDCASIAAGITLIYSTDDTVGDDEHRDYFQLEVYDGTLGHELAHIEESITEEISPFNWVTHRIEAASYNGLYRFEVWDTNANGDRLRLVEEAYYQCNTGNSWRPPSDERPDDPEMPNVECYMRVPLYSTNTAPEPGVIVMMWTYSAERPGPEYHLATRPVAKGDSLDELEVRAPCGTYLRLYFVPDSTRLLYSMPSQYYPHSPYGVPEGEPESVAPSYNTVFPFNDLPRDVTPSPTPTETPTPTPTPAS
jgi:hypothetical protein